MSVGLAALAGTVCGVLAGFLAARYDLPGWVLHLWARVLGATWFTPRYACPSCGRRVHLVRSRPDRAGIFGMTDGGGRCLSCATSPGNAPQNAPGRTEERPEVPPSISGWLRAPGDASEPHRQDRTDERNEQ